MEMGIGSDCHVRLRNVRWGCVGKHLVKVYGEEHQRNLQKILATCRVLEDLGGPGWLTASQQRSIKVFVLSTCSNVFSSGGGHLERG